MRLNDILIFGHTHRPYNDVENKVANTGAWIEDMLVHKWFEEEHGQYKACSGWYIELDNGKYKLVPYGIHQKTETEWKNSESNKQEENKNGNRNRKEHENIVSKTASQVGEAVKQMVDAGSNAIKQDSSTKPE